MGTNYFAVKNGPTVRETPIHIGKSSIGWMFLFQEQGDTWRDVPVEWHCYEDVRNWLKKYTVDSTDYVIMDEYDEVVSFEDLFGLIEAKQNDEHCRNNPENFSHCKNVNGYRFEDREFS
jgi:hypothetical protein